MLSLNALCKGACYVLFAFTHAWYALCGIGAWVVILRWAFCKQTHDLVVVKHRAPLARCCYFFWQVQQSAFVRECSGQEAVKFSGYFVIPKSGQYPRSSTGQLLYSPMVAGHLLLASIMGYCGVRSSVHSRVNVWPSLYLILYQTFRPKSGPISRFFPCLYWLMLGLGACIRGFCPGISHIRRLVSLQFCDRLVGVTKCCCTTLGFTTLICYRVPMLPCYCFLCLYSHSFQSCLNPLSSILKQFEASKRGSYTLQYRNIWAESSHKKLETRKDSSPLAHFRRWKLVSRPLALNYSFGWMSSEVPSGCIAASSVHFARDWTIVTGLVECFLPFHALAL